MFAIKVVLFILVFAKYSIFVTSVCEKSFVIICESMLDVQYNTTKKSWSELLVQPSNAYTQKFVLTSQQLDNELKNLKWLVINNHLEDIRRKAFTYHKSLEHLILYGNSLEVIRRDSFFAFKNMQKLSLEHNNIKRLERGAFSGSTITTIDMSYNNIEVLVSHVFAGKCTVETISITHNQLWRIEADSLPTNLKRLHLDYNNFQGIPDELENLQELKELTLSHNGIVSTSGLGYLRQLSKLDISFNKIDSISDEFDDMEQLDYLNLSGNRLEKLTFTPQFIRNIKSPTKTFTLLLAHNLLRNLDLQQIRDTDITFTLSGNPWNCKCIERIQKVMDNNNITRTACDHIMFSSGQYPYCINDVHSCSEERVSDELFRLFQYSFKDRVCDVFDDVDKFVH